MAEINAFEVSAAGSDIPFAPHAPTLSHATCYLLRNISVLDESGIVRSIHVPEERSLTIFLDDREVVTLMTLGGAPELMVLGFLLNQKFIAGVASVDSIEVDWSLGVARVRRRMPGTGTGSNAFHTAATGSGAGSVYADLLRQIASVELPPPSLARLSRETLLTILETMPQHDAIHREAGSVHGCALFRGSELLVCVEDVGRHNAMDTITGWMSMRDCPGGDKILFTTGRLTSEMVMKIATSGIPIAVSRNGVSAMGLDLARSVGMALIGRAAKQRYLCYLGTDRFDVV